jgi:hypothetical protein
MAFHELPFHVRMEKMGDEAEGEFENATKSWARFGFNRPPFTIQNLPLVIRYSPDYIHSNPQRLIEVVGMGKKGLRLKLEKIRALTWWDTVMPTHLWVWSTPRQQHCEIPLKDLMKLIDKNDVPLYRFSEGKAYFQIRPSLFPWDDE